MPNSWQVWDQVQPLFGMYVSLSCSERMAVQDNELLAQRGGGGGGRWDAKPQE